MTPSSILRRSIVLVRIWIRLFVRKPIGLWLIDRWNCWFNRKPWCRRFRIWNAHRVYRHIDLLSKPTAFNWPLFREVAA